MAAVKCAKVLLAASALAACVQAAPASSLTKRTAEPKTVRMPISKHVKTISKRQSFQTASLNNQVYRYTIQVEVGTPPQTISLELDTGSSDTWVFSDAGCSDVTCVGGYFDPTQSSTYALANSNVEFDQSYVDGSFISGNYFTDTMGVAGVSLTALEMGLATSGNGILNGIMGVSFDDDEAEFSQSGLTYPTIIDTMFTQEMISVHAYSLYLDDLNASTGEIIFGGYDNSKWSGTLTSVPIVPGPNAGFWVNWNSLSITDSSGTTTLDTSTTLPTPALLDSGTASIRVPASIYSPIATYFNVNTADNTIDCNIGNTQGSVDFAFDGVSISVPFSEMAFPADPSTGTCNFVFYQVGDGGDVILGDPFLRSAYVYYDLDNYVCGLAQTVFT